jgi:hypothetical protein
MRKDFELPNDFSPIKNINGHEIEYKDVRELSQGGPLVGKISVDSILISDKLFGGPFVNDDKFIYIPMYQRKLFKTGFKLAQISLVDKKIKVLTKEIKALMFLINIENNKIGYLETVSSKTMAYINIQ